MHKATSKFWNRYHELPYEVQRTADKIFKVSLLEIFIEKIVDYT